jgi:hypothetical protein
LAELVSVSKRLGWIAPGVAIASVLETVDGALRHRYLVLGGPDDGRQFDDLWALGEYVSRLSRLPDGERP